MVPKMMMKTSRPLLVSSRSWALARSGWVNSWEMKLVGVRNTMVLIFIPWAGRLAMTPFIDESSLVPTD